MFEKAPLLLFVLLIAAQSIAFAQSDAEPVRQSGVIENVPPKSETKARNLALGFTVPPVILGLMARDSNGYIAVLAGLTFGPSAGLYYAGERNQAGGGILLRTLGSGIIYLGTGYLWMGAISDSDEVVTISSVAILASGLLVIYSALHDTFTRGPRAVREFNRKSEISLSPWISPDTATPGLQLNVRF